MNALKKLPWYILPILWGLLTLPLTWAVMWITSFLFSGDSNLWVAAYGVLVWAFVLATLLVCLGSALTAPEKRLRSLGLTIFVVIATIAILSSI